MENKLNFAKINKIICNLHKIFLEITLGFYE